MYHKIAFKKKSFISFPAKPSTNMAKRRSKRKSTVLNALHEGGRLRRSKRKAALREDEHKIYGNDYGILPSD